MDFGDLWFQPVKVSLAWGKSFGKQRTMAIIRVFICKNAACISYYGITIVELMEGDFAIFVLGL